MYLFDQVKPVIEGTFRKLTLLPKLTLTVPLLVKDIQCQLADVQVGAQGEVENLVQRVFRHIAIDRLCDLQGRVQLELFSF